MIHSANKGFRKVLGLQGSCSGSASSASQLLLLFQGHLLAVQNLDRDLNRFKYCRL